MSQRCVWKFPLAIEDGPQAIAMPFGAEILDVQAQGPQGQPTVWALVNPAKPKRLRSFQVFGTGHPIDEEAQRLRYVGTTQMLDGTLVWHIFEVGT